MNQYCQIHGTKMYEKNEPGFGPIYICPDCEDQKNRREEADRQESLLYEKLELEKERVDSEADCYLCGQKYQKKTVRVQKAGESWRGVLQEFSKEGVCPKCYFQRKEKDEIHIWNNEEWREYYKRVILSIKNIKTAIDAKKIIDAYENIDEDLKQQAANIIEKLEREEAERQSILEENRKKQQKIDEMRAKEKREKEKAEEEKYKQYRMAKEEEIRHAKALDAQRLKEKIEIEKQQEIIKEEQRKQRLVEEEEERRRQHTEFGLWDIVVCTIRTGFLSILIAGPITLLSLIIVQQDVFQIFIYIISTVLIFMWQVNARKKEKLLEYQWIKAGRPTGF